MAGRPSKFNDLDLEKVRKLTLKGFTDKELADFFDINIDTWHEWKKVHPEFSDSLKCWKDEADNKVERSLYERACGYKMKDTIYASFEGMITDIKEIEKHYPPDTTACIFWLKNRKKADWRDGKSIELDDITNKQRQITVQDQEAADLLGKIQSGDIGTN